MTCFNVMAIAVNHRNKNAAAIQDVLTKYGCSISARIGLHEAGDVCSDSGLIILQLTGKAEDFEAFSKELSQIEGVNAKLIEICS